MTNLPKFIAELCLLALMFSLLAVIVRKRAAIQHLREARREITFNIILAVIDSLAIAPIMLIAISLARTPIDAILPRHQLGLLRYDLPPLIIVAAICAGDLVSYWRHRIEHCRWLWPSHALHHSDGRMSWTTGYRFHPLNRLSTSLIDGLTLYALGFPAYAIVINNIVRHWYGIWIHADLPWTYGIFKRIFVSPVFHRWHHVTDSSVRAQNFATIFSAYDWIFGTYYLPDHKPGRTGVDGETGRSFVLQLLHPFQSSSYR